MPAVEIRGPLIIKNPDALAQVIGRETLVICGAPRGKTSIAGYVFANLGYYLGDRLSEQNHEDQDVLDALPPVEVAMGPAQVEAFEALVQKRDAEHVRWGFKLPHASGRLTELQGALRNPVFFLCLRNPIGVARTIFKRDPEFKGESIGEHLEVGLRPFMSLIEMVDGIDAPLILCDMDEVSLQPKGFVEQIARLFGLTGPMDQIAASISVSGYKKRLLSPSEVDIMRKSKSDAAARVIHRTGNGA